TGRKQKEKRREGRKKERREDGTEKRRDRNRKRLLGQKAEKVERLENGKGELTLDSGRRRTTDMVLFAAGRTGATDALNLQAIGLDAD
ncbi:hypothetical protein ACC705_34650, partial [Rhizobium ruizarguesonis]